MIGGYESFALLCFAMFCFVNFVTSEVISFSQKLDIFVF